MKINLLISLEIKEMEDALHLEEKELETEETVSVEPVEDTMSTSTSSDRRTRGVYARSAWAALIPGSKKLTATFNKGLNKKYNHGSSSAD